jgi:hypothetical protein
MHFRLGWALLILATLTGCGASNQTSTTTPAPAVTKHAYHGTASVGDFLNITIDTSALTISYTNLSNGDSGTVPYTVNADGSYTLNDPKGNLIAAYEVPGYALLIQAAKTGPNLNTPALITAVESGPISMATFSGKSYNYMQFRTAAGGLEIGSVTIGATSGQNSSYWPYGNLNSSENSPFHNSTLDFSQLQTDPSGTFFKSPDGNGSSAYDYLFGTASGFFIVDTPNGSILGLQKAATKDFDPSVAGTYNAIYYQKTGANTGQGNVETGTPSLGKASIAITATGGVTITDAQGKILTQATLTPVADASYLYGSSSELQDPCYGLFTFRVTTASSQQDVFVTFVQNAVVFSSFGANLPWSPGNSTYNYIYGVGLK